MFEDRMLGSRTDDVQVATATSDIARRSESLIKYRMTTTIICVLVESSYAFNVHSLYVCNSLGVIAELNVTW